jgi:glycosyltransferase involved in cell wall biosynthesis
MKGLEEAITITSRLEVPALFKIFGTVSNDEYWLRCKQILKGLPPFVEHAYEGEFKPGEAQSIFARSSLMLLPTRGENFGHAVSEALSVGCPVVLPRGVTPWDDVLDAGGGLAYESLDEAVQFVNDVLKESFPISQERRKKVFDTYVAWFTVRDQGYATDSGCLVSSLFWL